MEPLKIREAVKYAAKFTGKVMVYTNRRFKKSSVHRKVKWIDDDPYVTVNGIRSKIVGFKNLNNILRINRNRKVYIFDIE